LQRTRLQHGGGTAWALYILTDVHGKNRRTPITEYTGFIWRRGEPPVQVLARIAILLR
jgi:hypothetical protein